MEKFLPLFPLSIVVYPLEPLNLHIFEPRYKQLIAECFEQKTTFGIPAFIKDRMNGYGTEVEIIKIEKVYEDGRMDVKTRGLQVFRIVSFDNPVKNKLYSGGNVVMIRTDRKVNDTMQRKLLDKINELYKILQIHQDVYGFSFTILSFEIAHRIGLSIEQEYELLCLEKEKERQKYLLDHLEKSVPVIKEMERTKQLARMNGQFKYFDPLNF